MDWGFAPSTRRRTCMLMITHACNLNCNYCYEPHKGHRYMELDLAKSIISREAQFVLESDEFDELGIDLMGGEPFTNFALIKDVVEWLETGSIRVPWICYVGTNGTLLSDEVKGWLQRHKNSIVVCASDDGDEQMQLTNRGTQNFDIDLRFFKELWPRQPLHMTVSKETLPSLAEGVLNIQRKGYEVDVSLAQGINWTLEDAFVYREQLCKLKDTYLKDVSLIPINVLRRFVGVYSSADVDRKQGKWCGAGKYMATYDIDGKMYGCHMFTPLVLGSDKALLADAVEWDSPRCTTDHYCDRCVLRSFCPTCAGFNYKYRNDIAERDKCRCPMILAEALSVCEFQIERIAIMDDLGASDAEHGEVALHAYNLLKHLDVGKNESPYIV